MLNIQGDRICVINTRTNNGKLQQTTAMWRVGAVNLRDAVHAAEELQVVLERRIVAMPRHNVKHGALAHTSKQLASKLKAAIGQM